MIKHTPHCPAQIAFTKAIRSLTQEQRYQHDKDIKKARQEYGLRTNDDFSVDIICTEKLTDSQVDDLFSKCEEIQKKYGFPTMDEEEVLCLCGRLSKIGTT